MRENLTIIKVGGAVVEDKTLLHDLLESFVAIPGHKILVHGGGRTATSIASRLGIETTMVNGRRVTDKSMLEVVTMVYGGLVNKNIVAQMQALGMNAIGVTGADMNVILSDRRIKGDVDYGYVGDVRCVNADTLTQLLNIGIVPVMAPLTHDGKGSMLNTNADSIACQVAMAMAKTHNVKLIYCFDKKGVLSNPHDEDSVIPLITAENYPGLLSDGIITDGMIPKIENALSAVETGVEMVRITSTKDLNGGTAITQ
jgi:acetylglutamate kinase